MSNLRLQKKLHILKSFFEKENIAWFQAISQAEVELSTTSVLSWRHRNLKNRHKKEKKIKIHENVFWGMSIVSRAEWNFPWNWNWKNNNKKTAKWFIKKFLLSNFI